MEELDLRNETDRSIPVEDLEPVALNKELSDRVVYIGSLLDTRLCEELIQFLKKNQDVFAWCHDDMPGIDPRITSHRVNENLDFCVVKQKRRAMAPKP